MDASEQVPVVDVARQPLILLHQREASGREPAGIPVVFGSMRTSSRTIGRFSLAVMTLIFPLLEGCSAAPTAPGNSPPTPKTQHAPSLDRTQCARAEPLPSREGFFNEVLFPEPSARTPLFNEYRADSYHVTKLDLVQGLPEQARLCGVRLKAILVVGPLGPLWTYQVAALVEDGSGIRVNALVMPHARITGKGTGVLSMKDAALMVRGIQHAALVRAGAPAKEPRDLDADFTYRLLLATYDHGRPEYFHAVFDESSANSDVPPLLERVNALLAAAQTRTYKHGDVTR